MSSEAPPHILVERVSKRFARRRGAGYSLRGMLFADRREDEHYWALRDVSFAVPRGASTGLVGGNGAGKSTLLRLAAGLSRPTEGSIRVPEDTLSVLALGANFDGTLTGRENAETALVVNGLSRRAARERLPRVLQFAELEEFFESPVRTYSQGMILRLAFGVAAQLDAEAFLVDEVLAVGDVRFQEKCVQHLTGLRQGGATIVMASHDLHLVREFCDQVVWLHAGRVRRAGPAEEVLDAYEGEMRSATMQLTPPEAGGSGLGLELRRNRFGSQDVRLEDVRVNGGREANIQPGDGIRLTAVLEPAAGARRAQASVSIRRVADGLEIINQHADLGLVESRRELALEIGRLDLAPGSYEVDIGVYAADWSHAYDYHWAAYRLEVAGVPPKQGLVHPPVRWSTARIEDAVAARTSDDAGVDGRP